MSKTTFEVDKEKLEVTMTRVFDASRKQVWKALTNREAIPRWWGPRNLTTKVDKMDVKENGLWRFIQRDPDRKEYAFNGIYQEIVPPDRLVYTFEFESLAGHVVLETIKLEGIGGGKTKMTDLSLYETLEDLEGMINSGMELGARESMERLAEYLKEK